jgi:hypothetical protein
MSCKHPMHGRRTAPAHPPRDPQVAYQEQQALVLDELLREYPALMTCDEARLARVHDPDDRGERDAFENAVRGLGSAGLIRRQGDLLVPSRPAREMVGLGFRLG